MSLPRTMPQILALLAVAGCASEPLLPAPPIGLLDRLDPQAISVASDAHVLALERPVSSAEAGASVGAGQAAGTSILGGFASCVMGPACAIGVAAGVVLALPAAVVGAGVGALRARSPEEVESARTDLLAVLGAQRPAAAMQQRMRDLAQAQWTPVERRDLKTLPDMSLEIRFTDYDLRVFGKINPGLTVVMAVNGDLVARDTNRLLYRRLWRYESEERNFFELSADAGAPLRKEFDVGYDRLAQRIIDDLSAPEQSERTGEGESGTAWTEDAFDFDGLAAVSDGARCGEDLRAFILRIDGEPPAADIFVAGTFTVPPGDHVLSVVCSSFRTVPRPDDKRCGEIAFRAETGHDYALRWSLVGDRLSLHDIRPDAMVASGTTWSRLEHSVLAAVFNPPRC